MQTTHQRTVVLNSFRRYPRVRTLIPFSCSLSRLDFKRKGWFQKPDQNVGVVYDLSLRGIRVSTEAMMRPGDMVALTLCLPKQIVPAKVAVATVRWAKGQIYGLAFRRLSQSSLGRLSKYMAVISVGKERKQYGTDQQIAHR